jgi:uncharacterized membrane protein
LAIQEILHNLHYKENTHAKTKDNKATDAVRENAPLVLPLLLSMTVPVLEEPLLLLLVVLMGVLFVVLLGVLVGLLPVLPVLLGVLPVVPLGVLPVEAETVLGAPHELMS